MALAWRYRPPVSGDSGQGATTPIVQARIAGFAYLFVIVLGVLTVGLVDGRLVVPGDDAATAANIAGHRALYRVGILGVIALYVGVLIIAWALYVVLKPFGERVALLALLLRVAEGIVGCATAILGFAVLAATDRGSAEPAIVGMLLETRTDAMDIVLVLVGLGGAAFCTLLFTSRLVPRLLSAWGIVTYASMLALAVLSISWPEHPPMVETILYGAGTLFELALGLWLLIRAIDRDRWQARVTAPS